MEAWQGEREVEEEIFTSGSIREPAVLDRYGGYTFGEKLGPGRELLRDWVALPTILIDSNS